MDEFLFPLERFFLGIFMFFLIVFSFYFIISIGSSIKCNNKPIFVNLVEQKVRGNLPGEGGGAIKHKVIFTIMMQISI